MKKITAPVLLSIILFIVSVVDAKGLVLKCSFIFSYVVPSTEIKFEQSIYKNFGLGVGIRKEGRWGYNGYYLSLYPTYTIKRNKFFLGTSIGLKYGIPSTVYDKYLADYRDGKLIFQKWVFVVQNVSIPGDKVNGKSGILYPFGTISYGKTFWRIVVETGLDLQMMKFGVKSTDFESRIYKDEKKWKLIPGIFIQIGIKLF